MNEGHALGAWTAGMRCLEHASWENTLGPTEWYWNCWGGTTQLVPRGFADKCWYSQGELHVTVAGVPEEALLLDPRQNSVLRSPEWPEDAGVHSILLLWIEAQKLKTKWVSFPLLHFSVSCQDLAFTRPNWNPADIITCKGIHREWKIYNTQKSINW